MESKLFSAMKAIGNDTITTNGMPAVISTLDPVLDLFVKGPSCRGQADTIQHLVTDAYRNSPLYTLRCLFYLRDIRGGQGEREIFRQGIKKIAELNVDAFVESNIISFIPEYGRWDDVFCLFDISKKLDKQIIGLVEGQFVKDIEELLLNKEKANISLLAKWLPSCNTSSNNTRKLARRIYTALGLTEREYRKGLSRLRRQIKVLETYLSRKDYSFDYNSVPSTANLKYRKCFMRNDETRYTKHIADVKDALNGIGNAKVNVKDLYPYEIVSKVHNCYTQADKDMLDNMWRSLPNYFTNNSANENWLAVVDVSGSMYSFGPPCPVYVAVSLGMYIAEHNNGIFKDKFITFSEKPSLVEFDSSWPLFQKVEHFSTAAWGYSTNLISVFDLVLEAAQEHHISEKEMPTTLVIISDMQFNAAINDGNERAFTIIKQKYENAGYKMPQIIFWNAAQHDYDNLPVTKNELGVTLMSGCKPGMFEQLLANKTPIEFMFDVLNSERYQQINLG